MFWEISSLRDYGKTLTVLSKHASVVDAAVVGVRMYRPRRKGHRNQQRK
jgi:hypothetical protein